jgi:N-acetyl-gamma-glutamyl-phosphate reductase
MIILKEECDMMQVSIIGATGYAGADLLRLLLNHQEITLSVLTSESYAGQLISQVYPHLKGHVDIMLDTMNIDLIVNKSDVVFVALPHGHAMNVVPTLLSAGKKVIDFGADYRLSDPAIFEQWYKHTHVSPETKAVYGLPELNRTQIIGANLVANPGCYPTATILAIAPLLREGLVDPHSVIVDAKSGISGAGRGLGLASHYAEATENVKAYNIGGHRHTPEIEQELSLAAGETVTISFTPHLMPMSRGILSTCYMSLKPGVTLEHVTDAFNKAYANEFFVRLLGAGQYPATKNVRGTNHCDIGWYVDLRTNRVIIVSAIDNLVKGAAGQALQNMNIICGLPETTGLKFPALYP